MWHFITASGHLPRIEDDTDPLLWQQGVERADKPQTIRMTTLQPGKYTLVNSVNNATNGVICMTDTLAVEEGIPIP